MARFRIETRKEVGGYGWVNSWGVEAAGIAVANSAGLAIATFEQALLANIATMVGIKTSAWPNPTGTAFIYTSIGGAGGRALANPQPAEMCAFLEIPAATGRPGKKWLRMTLDESDVAQSGGMPVISGGSGIVGLVDDAADDLWATLNTLDVQLLIGGGYLSARQAALQPHMTGIGFRDTDVGWYNRAAPPP